MSLNATKIAVFAGTRPEVVKTQSIYRALSNLDGIEALFCSTSQQTNILSETLKEFNLVPDVTLESPEGPQSLNAFLARAIQQVGILLEERSINGVVVQGDTTTGLAVTLAAFNLKVPVFHVEAGLRTGDLSSPFPEEANRRIIDLLSSGVFPPTEDAKANLVKENPIFENAVVVGNTGTDSFLEFLQRHDVQYSSNPSIEEALRKGKKLILLTSHRRENFGETMEDIFVKLNSYVAKREDVHLIFPVHPNPAVKKVAERIFGNNANVEMISPLPYRQFIGLIKIATVVITDSGGLQEELLYTDKPLIIIRESTERPEVLTQEGVFLAGTNPQRIVDILEEQVMNPTKFNKREALFGSGNSGELIAQEIVEFYRNRFSTSQ